MWLLLALLPVVAAVPPNHGSPASLPPGCLPKDGQQDLFCPVRDLWQRSVSERAPRAAAAGAGAALTAGRRWEQGEFGYGCFKIPSLLRIPSSGRLLAFM